MGRSILFAAAPNLVPYMTVSALGTTPAGMGPDKLKNEEPTERCRITSLDSSITGWVFAVPSAWPKSANGSSRIVTSAHPQMDVFAAINHNFTPDSALYRLISGTTNTVPFARVAPTSIVSTTNASGVIGSIDESPFSPDNTFVSATTHDIDTTVRVRFPNVASPLLPGAKMQAFRVALRMHAASTVGKGFVVNLYENGTLKSVLSYEGGNIVPNDGNVHVFTAYWDTSLLSSTSPVNLDAEVGMSAGAFDLEAIDWLQELATGTFGTILDTGWLTVPQINDSALWGNTNQPNKLPTNNLYYLADSFNNLGSTYTQFFVRDPLNVDGFVQFGVAVISPQLSLGDGSGMKQDSFYLRIISESRGGTTLGGQTYAADAWRRRAFGFDLLITRDEDNSLLNRIDYAKGNSGALLVLIEPDIGTTYQEFQAMWATVKTAGDSVPMSHMVSNQGAKMFTKHYDMEEKL